MQSTKGALIQRVCFYLYRNWLNWPRIKLAPYKTGPVYIKRIYNSVTFLYYSMSFVYLAVSFLSCCTFPLFCCEFFYLVVSFIYFTVFLSCHGFSLVYHKFVYVAVNFICLVVSLLMLPLPFKCCYDFVCLAEFFSCRDSYEPP